MSATPVAETPIDVLSDDQQVETLAAELDQLSAQQDAGEQDASADLADEPSDDAGQDWITPAVAYKAAQAGLSLDQIADFGDEIAFNAALNLIAGRGGDRKDPSKPSQAAPQQDILQELKLPEDFPTEESLVEALGEEAAKPVSKIMAFAKSLVDQNNALRSHLNPLLATQQSFEQERSRQQTAWVDDQFSKLGDDYVSLFGKGNFSQIQEQKAVLQNRLALVKALGLVQQMSPELSPDEAFKRALPLAFQKEVTAIQSKQRTTNIRSQQSRRIGAPTKPASKPTAGDALEREVSKLISGYHAENGNN